MEKRTLDQNQSDALNQYLDELMSDLDDKEMVQPVYDFHLEEEEEEKKKEDTSD